MQRSVGSSHFNEPYCTSCFELWRWPACRNTPPSTAGMTSAQAFLVRCRPPAATARQRKAPAEDTRIVSSENVIGVQPDIISWLVGQGVVTDRFDRARTSRAKRDTKLDEKTPAREAASVSAPGGRNPGLPAKVNSAPKAGSDPNYLSFSTSGAFIPRRSAYSINASSMTAVIERRSVVASC